MNVAERELVNFCLTWWQALLANQAEFAPDAEKEVVLSIVGTLMDPKGKRPKCVGEIVDATDKAALQAALLGCSHITYDITQHASQVVEADWAVQALSTASGEFTVAKTFVCVSTIMTWGKTKPNEPDDAEATIAEDEYRRRRPHMNFRTHTDVEKTVLKLGKKENGMLRTYVVAAGLLYGEGEQLFHRFFKDAWHLSPAALSCYGTGLNVLPCIHVRDLASIAACVTSSGPGTRYIVAVDEGNCSLEEILKAISQTLGTGKVTKIPKEDALTQSDLTQTEYDSLLLNLRLETQAIKDLNMTWVAMSGFVENIITTVAEYKKTRGLTALKLALFGPPGAGKSFLARQLAAHYKLPHVHMAGIIQATLDRLQAAIAALENPDVTPEETEKADAAKEELAEARANIESNAGRYSEDLLAKWTRDMLSAGACRNQGFVLDGLPKTTPQAKDVFGQGEEVAMEILPEHLFVVEATDEFIKERIMSLPEAEVAGTHNTEEGLARRLAKYRMENTEDATVVNYFDLLEVHPTYLPADNSSALFERAVQVAGAPHNYGLTPAESAAIAAADAERKAAADARADEERARVEQALATETAKAQASWDAVRTDVQRQHADARDAAALPLRAYLVKNVLPTLSRALMDVCEVRPEDPIDFLAEYLFKNNPKLD